MSPGEMLRLKDNGAGIAASNDGCWGYRRRATLADRLGRASAARRSALGGSAVHVLGRDETREPAGPRGQLAPRQDIEGQRRQRRGRKLAVKPGAQRGVAAAG